MYELSLLEMYSVTENVYYMYYHLHICTLVWYVHQLLVELNVVLCLGVVTIAHSPK